MLRAAGPAGRALDALARLELPDAARGELAKLGRVVELVRAGAPDLALTVPMHRWCRRGRHRRRSWSHDDHGRGSRFHDDARRGVGAFGDDDIGASFGDRCQDRHDSGCRHEEQSGHGYLFELLRGGLGKHSPPATPLPKRAPIFERATESYLVGELQLTPVGDTGCDP